MNIEFVVVLAVAGDTGPGDSGHAGGSREIAVVLVAVVASCPL